MPRTTTIDIGPEWEPVTLTEEVSDVPTVPATPIGSRDVAPAHRARAPREVVGFRAGLRQATYSSIIIIALCAGILLADLFGLLERPSDHLEPSMQLMGAGVGASYGK